MSKLYYQLLYKLDGRSAVLIWISNGNDGVVTRNGRVLSFSSGDSLSHFAMRHQLPLCDEPPTLHDLDGVRHWTLRPRAETIDCTAALAAWNLFGDVARSLPGPAVEFLRLDRAHGEIYEKLSFRTNLPAMTPAGARYVPTWSGREVDALVAILDCGLRLFRLLREEVSA